MICAGIDGAVKLLMESKDKDPSTVLNDEQLQILTSDPISYFIFQQVTLGDIKSITQIEDSLSRRLDLKDRIHPTLQKMARAGMILMDGDRIVVLKSQLRQKLSSSVQGKLFPLLFKIAAQRAVGEIDRLNDNDIIAISTSDDAEIRSEIKQAIAEFKQRMRDIGKRASQRPSKGTRFIGLVNSLMVGSDYAPTAAENPDEIGPEYASSIEKKLMQVRQAAHDMRAALAGARVVLPRIQSQVDLETAVLSEAIFKRVEDIAADFLPAKYGGALTLRHANVAAVADQIACEKSQLWGSSVSLETIGLKGASFYANISPVDLGRVLSNILDNAYESLGSEKRLIALSAIEKGGSIEIMVKDSGCGIDNDQLSSIRSGIYGTTKPQGSGLGIRHALRFSIEQAVIWK